MVDPLSGAVGGALAKEATVEFVRGPLSWAKEWARGGYILIIGQRRSGKSSFFKFLRTRRLNKRGESRKTLEPESSGVFRFTWREVSIIVRNARDNPGQIGPYEHARIVLSKAPHVVVIFLDLTTYVSDSEQDAEEDDCLGWFRSFCDYLNEQMARGTIAGTRLKRRLKTFVIVLNKVDVAKENLAAVQKGVRSAMQDNLKFHFGPEITRNSPIVECCLVSDAPTCSVEQVHELIYNLVDKLSDSLRR